MGFNPLADRRARVTINVSRPGSGGTVQDLQYVFEQHRMRITVRQGGAQFGNARVEIFGASLQAMNQIARLWLESLVPVNTDTVAIDVWDGQDFVPFFSGVITWSAVNASAMPDVKLEVEANAAMELMNDSASSYSNPGPVTLLDALTTIAGLGGFAVDYSATAPVYSLTDVRVTGSSMTQIIALMRQFPDLAWFTHLQRLVVRKANAPFEDDPIRIAADTGMQSYPVYSTSGLQFATLFNPRLRPGVSLDVQTQFDFVNRTAWVAAVLAHQLEPNMPGGQWTTSIAANSFGPKGNRQ